MISRAVEIDAFHLIFWHSPINKLSYDLHIALITFLKAFLSPHIRCKPGLQILIAANYVCNLCNIYLQMLQSFASAVLQFNDSCKYLQTSQIKVACLTTKAAKIASRVQLDK
jgi:hypothetical protein